MKKKKVLFVATVDSHIELFHLPYLKMFHDKGYEVHVATDTRKKIPYCDKKICLPIKRSPFKVVPNMRAVRELKKVMGREGYEIVHCHTPMGGVVARMAGRKARKQGTRMIYTAHGFHFYTGAPVHYWMMFHPVEWYLAKFTDTLITINDEDYQRARKRFGRRCHDIQYVPGVGVDEKKFAKRMNVKEKRELRESLGLGERDRVLICVGRLDENKNQGFLIRAMKELVANDSHYQLLLVGPDELDGRYQKLADKLGVASHVHFLGFRKDIPELLQIADVAVSASKREGLPVNLIEAAMVGLPIVATDCRGSRDVCKICGGLVCEKGNTDEFAKNARKAQGVARLQQEDFGFGAGKIESMMKEIYGRKRRVLHVLASNKYSGAENVACMIIRNLSEDFDMAYCSPKGPIEKKLKGMGVKFIGMDKLSRKSLKKVIDAYSPDIIHAHDFRASLTAARFGRHIKVVSHIHLDNPKVRRLSIWSVVYFVSATRYKCIIWVSEDALKNYFFNHNKIVKDKSTVLVNVIDRKYIENEVVGYAVDEDYDLVFLGRLSEQKNPERMLEIVKLIKLQRDDIKVAIVGDGEMREKVESLINKYGLRKNTKMFGFRNNPYPILNASKIMLITSRYEGTPMAILEAQALGKPIVGAKIGGLEELIVNGKNGYMLDGNEQIVEEVLRILDGQEYKVFSRNTGTLFRKNNKFSEYLQKILLVYCCRDMKGGK